MGPARPRLLISADGAAAAPCMHTFSLRPVPSLLVLHAIVGPGHTGTAGPCCAACKGNVGASWPSGEPTARRGRGEQGGGVSSKVRQSNGSQAVWNSLSAMCKSGWFQSAVSRCLSVHAGSSAVAASCCQAVQKAARKCCAAAPHSLNASAFSSAGAGPLLIQCMPGAIWGRAARGQAGGRAIERWACTPRAAPSTELCTQQQPPSQLHQPSPPGRYAACTAPTRAARRTCGPAGARCRAEATRDRRAAQHKGRSGRLGAAQRVRQCNAASSSSQQQAGAAAPASAARTDRRRLSLAMMARMPAAPSAAPRACGTDAYERMAAGRAGEGLMVGRAAGSRRRLGVESTGSSHRSRPASEAAANQRQRRPLFCPLTAQVAARPEADFSGIVGLAAQAPQPGHAGPASGGGANGSPRVSPRAAGSRPALHAACAPCTQPPLCPSNKDAPLTS